VGNFDKGLKIIRLELDGKDFKIVVEGLAGQSYHLPIAHAELVKEAAGARLDGGRLLIQFPPGKEREFLRQEIVLKLQ